MNERLKNILESINSSFKNVKVLPIEESVLSQVLENFHIKEESLLGTIIFNTGGIIIDSWIRIYGAGKVNFCQRNKDFPYSNIIVAEDILGGLFAYMSNGNIGYFAPDTLEWEDMEIGYSQFLYWCFHGDTDTFYKDFRWNSWSCDVSDLPIDYGIAFYPFLWTERNVLEKCSLKKIPIKEIIDLEINFSNQLNKI